MSYRPASQHSAQVAPPTARPEMAGLTRVLIPVFLGGTAGSAARVAVGRALSGGGFPFATLAVNLVGAFLLGWFLGRDRSPWVFRFWGVGVLGSFTTFSTFGLETFSLMHAGDPGLALSYVAASLLGGLAAAVAGRHLGNGR